MKQNKRKHKKRLKKCFNPIVDELGILTMSEEERVAFYKNVQKYSLRCFSYKRYKDKEKARKKAMEHPTIYAPSGKAIEKHLLEMSKTIRGYGEPKSVIVFQNLNQLREAYEGVGELS